MLRNMEYIKGQVFFETQGRSTPRSQNSTAAADTAIILQFALSHSCKNAV